MSAAPRSYYGRPVVKEPAWTWEVPWYLFLGGLAGTTSTLALAARVAGQRELADRARLVAAAAAAACPPLLIADLGRPARFLNMLRVFKPTSMMSVGSWVLAGYSGSSTGSAALALSGRLPRVQALLDAAAGGSGILMSTYTGGLVADTSIPAWHEARRELPLLFAASGVASAGAAVTLVTRSACAGPARRLAVTGAVAELGVGQLMRHRLGPLGHVYATGTAGAFHRAADATTTAGAALVAAGGRRRPMLARLGALSLLAGGVLQRWAVYRAGFQSARDPASTIGPQRARLERGEGHRRG